MRFAGDHAKNVLFAQNSFGQAIFDAWKGQFRRCIDGNVPDPVTEGEQAFDRRNCPSTGHRRHPPGCYGLGKTLQVSQGYAGQVI